MKCDHLEGSNIFHLNAPNTSEQKFFMHNEIITHRITKKKRFFNDFISFIDHKTHN